MFIISPDSGSQWKCNIDQICKREFLTETSVNSLNTQPIASCNSGSTTSKLNDDDAIEMLPPSDCAIDYLHLASLWRRLKLLIDWEKLVITY